MMWMSAVASVLLATSTPLSDPTIMDATVQVGVQDPATDQAEPVHLGDVVVTGRRLEHLVRDFVTEVAEPNGYRGLARWEDRVCVGVAHLRADAAQYITDRISTVARDMGLIAGTPDCVPNILVVAAKDAGELTQTLVTERKQAFRMGGSGMDRGRNALNDFVNTDRPVRWWQQAIPVDAETGQRAVRIPGECRNSCSVMSDYAPLVHVDGASRIRTQIVDRLFRTVVIVDWEKVEHLSLNQLADYVAMISLAQIDPDADTTPYASILNVVDDPFAAGGLTDWDVAYLSGLYSAEQNRVNRRTNRAEIADVILQAHARLRSADVADDVQE